jgi:hypothetical protein
MPGESTRRPARPPPAHEEQHDQHEPQGKTVHSEAQTRGAGDLCIRRSEFEVANRADFAGQPLAGIQRVDQGRGRRRAGVGHS